MEGDTVEPPAQRIIPERLVKAPAFVLCSLRSGSTLLRVLLNSHPAIVAPHELHLYALRVRVAKAFGLPAVTELGLDARELEHMLWDGILARELRRSGKAWIVEKTPQNVFMWQRLLECWPDVRFLVLLRNPLALVDSLSRARPELSMDRVEREVLSYAMHVEEARGQVNGHVIRYESLVDRPIEVLSRVCEFLGVEWASGMIDYGRFEHGPLKPGLGDWSDRIRTGAIAPARPLPARALLSSELRAIAVSWGYDPGNLR